MGSPGVWVHRGWLKAGVGWELANTGTGWESGVTGIHWGRKPRARPAAKLGADFTGLPSWRRVSLSVLASSRPGGNVPRNVALSFHPCQYVFSMSVVSPGAGNLFSLLVKVALTMGGGLLMFLLGKYSDAFSTLKKLSLMESL